MFKKAVLMVFAAMLIVFSASFASANQVDGMASGTGPALPAGLFTSINPGGLGDALLYSYYNVRGNVNLFNIVNTSTVDGVKVRIVFRNANDSREVLDFNICLSRGDVWTAYLTDDGAQGIIYAIDTDTVSGAGHPFPASGIPFRPGTFSDGAVVTADQTREGYFEVVAMSSIPGYDKNSTTTTTCAVGASVSNCIRTAAACDAWRPTGSAYDAGNTIMGNNTIIDLSTLAIYSYNALAVADAGDVAFDVPAGFEMSIPLAINQGSGGIISAAAACNIADYIFTKSSLITPYDLLAGLGGETALVVTFPGRYVCHNIFGDSLYNCKDTGTPSPQGCKSFCTTVAPHVWNDREVELTGGSISPSPGSCLPWEVNVLNIGASSVVNSKVASSVSASNFELGWMELDLLGVAPSGTTHATENHSTTLGTYVNLGVPSVGLTLQSFGGGIASYAVPAAYKNKMTTSSTSGTILLP